METAETATDDVKSSSNGKFSSDVTGSATAAAQAQPQPRYPTQQRKAPQHRF